jgi:hypothetical protein
LIFSILQVNSAHVVELDGKAKALSFLSNVTMLDLSKYNVTPTTYRVTYPTQYGGVAQEEVAYILKTDTSELSATFFFRNGTFAFCLTSWRSGSPIYLQPQPTNLVDVAKGAIDRYQAFTGSSRCQPMRAMLDAVSKAENTVVTSGSMELEVTINNPRTTSFVWRYEGLATAWLEIVLHDGTLYELNDQWNIFTVDDEMEVSEAEAIDIAVNRAQNFSWTVNGVPVSNFTIIRENATTTLGLNSREPLKLNSFWRVDLPLDKVYPGGVFFISVGVWADTGAVSYIQELGGGGTPPTGEDDSQPPTTTPSETPSNPNSATPPTQEPSEPSSPTDTSTPAETETSSPTDTFPTTTIIAAATITTIAIAAATIYLKKKRKK